MRPDDAGDWMEDDPGSETLPCPSCGHDVYEDADKCPYCGDWIIPLADGHRRRGWVRVVAVLVVVAMLFWLIRALLRLLA